MFDVRTTGLRARRGPELAFGLKELLVILAVTVLFACMIAVSWRNGARRSKDICCNCNLKQVGLAFKLWANDNNGKYPMQVSVTNGGTMELVNNGAVFVQFLAMSNELSTPKVLICLEETDPARKLAATFDQILSPTISSQVVPFTSDKNLNYFVGVDAEDGLLSSRLLSGDWNLAIGGVPVKHGLYEIRTNALVSWVGSRHGHHGNLCLADGSVHQVDASGLRSVLIQSGVVTNRLAIP